MLRLESLSCGYGPMTVVHGLDLEIPAGRVTALIGANGAGKTSTIMAIAGHVAIKSGRVLFDGDDLTRKPPTARVKTGIALVPEGRRLFPDLTVEENLIVGGHSLPAPRLAPNQDRVFSLFPRLAERLRQRAGSLSGGEQQMLAIGRALMAEPRLIMIDELSLGLMPKMVDLCYEALGSLQDSGLTVLLVEQNTARVLRSADFICVLESGHAVWKGTAEQARSDPGLIESYLGGRVEGGR